MARLLVLLACFVPVPVANGPGWAASAQEEADAGNRVYASVEKAPPFQLTDQHKEAHRIAFPAGKVLFLIIADRKGSDEVEEWIEAVYKRYKDRIGIEGVANLDGVPKPLRGVVRGLFKRGVDHPVLLDWDGTVFKNYGCKSGAANVFVVERDGTIATRAYGAATEANIDNIASTLDGLLHASEDGASDAK